MVSLNKRYLNPARHLLSLSLFLKFENRKVTIFIVKLGRIAVLNILFFSASAIIKHY